MSADVDIEEFLVEPLTDHDEGLAAGIEAALAAITARVEAWEREVAV